MATQGSTETEVRPSAAPAERKNRRGLVAAAVIAAVVTAFAVLNLNDVKVHWLFTTAQTPLIVVVVLAVLLGMALDRLLVFRGRRRRH